MDKKTTVRIDLNDKSLYLEKTKNELVLTMIADFDIRIRLIVIEAELPYLVSTLLEVKTIKDFHLVEDFINHYNKLNKGTKKN